VVQFGPQCFCYSRKESPWMNMKVWKAWYSSMKYKIMHKNTSVIILACPWVRSCTTLCLQPINFVVQVLSMLNMVCKLKILLQTLYAYFNKSLWKDTWNAINLIRSWKLKNLWFIEKCQNKVDFMLELEKMIIEYCNVLVKVVVNSLTKTYQG